MPKLALLTAQAVRGVVMYDPAILAIGLDFLQRSNFPFGRLTPEPYRLTDVNAAYAAADAGTVPRGALVP